MKIEVDREERIKFVYQCDLCGKISIHRKICSICNRDICSDCTVFDPICSGDCQDKYCSACFNIGEKYIDKISEEQEKFDTIIENLKKEWIDEAIKAMRLTKEQTENAKLANINKMKIDS